METFKLALPCSSLNESQELEVSGERRLSGAGDSGVFKILSIGDQLATHDPRRVGQYEDGLAFATIDCDGPLAIAGRERGGDPYNRLGRRVR